MEIKQINYTTAGFELGIIELTDGTLLRCFEVHQIRTMWLKGRAFDNGKVFYKKELRDFQLPITSIRIQRLDKKYHRHVVEIREFLTSVCDDGSAKKAFRVLRELKQELIDPDLGHIDLSRVDIVLDNIDLPYIKNATGTAKAYFRGDLKRANNMKVVPKSVTVEVTGVDDLLFSILEAAASKE